MPGQHADRPRLLRRQARIAQSGKTEINLGVEVAASGKPRFAAAHRNAIRRKASKRRLGCAALTLARAVQQRGNLLTPRLHAR